MDTIAAIGTPSGAGGIGIIRISGERAKEILGKLFHPSAKCRNTAEKNSNIALPHMLRHGLIKRPGSGMVVDEVMAVLMPAPRSYTREDVAEIQCHGGSAVVAAILELVIENGARIAEPGEFTRRAFLNGRIDLSQAEAVADLIYAKSQNALKSAANQISGAIGRRIRDIMTQMVQVVADLEARIEFGSDGVDAMDNKALRGVLKNTVERDIEDLTNSFETGKIQREGYKVVIVGRTNVGKSSLLNRIIGEDKAIVTPIPGTTRDVVEAHLLMKGILIQIFDTAGFRNSRNIAEASGILKSVEMLRQADLVIYVIEAGHALSKDDWQILDILKTENTLLAINKIDLVRATTETEVPEACQKFTSAPISAATGEGVANLIGLILSFYHIATAKNRSGLVITSIRQKKCLDNALAATRGAVAALFDEGQEDLAVMELNDGIAALGMLRGEGVGDEILDDIFSRFCVGK